MSRDPHARSKARSFGGRFVLLTAAVAAAAGYGLHYLSTAIHRDLDPVRAALVALAAGLVVALLAARLGRREEARPVVAVTAADDFTRKLEAWSARAREARLAALGPAPAWAPAGLAPGQIAEGAQVIRLQRIMTGRAVRLAATA